MGQYYYGVILDKEKDAIRAAAYNGKLTESSIHDFTSFAVALSADGGHAHQRVVWSGDYSKKKDWNDNTLYHEIREKEDTPEEYPSVKYRQLPKRLKYVCDHTRKEYISIAECLEKYGNDNGNELNPIALLCCDPTCRFLGGGDYYMREGFHDVSRWYGHELSTEPSVPEDYKKLDLAFVQEGTPVWVCETIESELLHSNRYNRLTNEFMKWLDGKYGIEFRIMSPEKLKEEFKTFFVLIDAAAVKRFYLKMKEHADSFGGKIPETEFLHLKHDTEKRLPYLPEQGTDNKLFFFREEDGAIVPMPTDNVMIEFNGVILYVTEEGDIEPLTAENIEAYRQAMKTW